jgi:hypothetical protein
MSEQFDFFADALAPAAPLDLRALQAAGQRLIVSYGAGTNSTAILVGLHERGIRPDAITFANTGDEKPHTYRHIEEVNAWCAAAGFPAIETLGPVFPQQIADGSLSNECLRLGKLPAKAYGFSSCSAKWKMEPQQRFNRAFAEAQGIELSQITRLIGFDADEHSRVERGLAAADKKPVKEAYPLYAWGWGREECVAAIARAGLQQPGKSACYHCPSSRKGEILELRTTYPELFERACEIERRALAGEGQAPATTSRGLGRQFSWAEFVREFDAAAQGHEDFVRKHIPLFADVGMPEVDCGCYDG